MALGVPGRLRPRIIPTFGTTRVVGRQPYAPAAFTAGEIPGTHFRRLSRPQGTWFCRKEPQKKSPVTPQGIDPGTVRLVAQHLNHYTTPGPNIILLYYMRTNGSLERDIMIGQVDGCRRQGRPHLRWMDSIKENMGFGLEKLKEMVKDRNIGRRLVEEKTRNRERTNIKR